jgi:hypothetical protein
LPSGEVVALVDLVVVDEVGVGTLGPAAGWPVELVGKTVTAAGKVAPLTSKKLRVFSQ